MPTPSVLMVETCTIRARASRAASATLRVPWWLIGFVQRLVLPAQQDAAGGVDHRA